MLVIDLFDYGYDYEHEQEHEKKPGLLSQPGLFKIITPQMPLRRISRSLSVTGGRPSQGRLTSN
jgi:hypothetical protein